MKSLQALIDCGVKHLNFPLIVLVHYLGRCLTCQTLLPISKDTIVYGSADGAYTIHDSNPGKFDFQMIIHSWNLDKDIYFIFCNRNVCNDGAFG
jgi:hypothetical protein